MPRDGSGASDNVVEAGENQVHDRSSKAAPLPEAEAGEALEGMAASGGGSQGTHIGNTGSGKGEKEAFVDKEAERLTKS